MSCARRQAVRQQERSHEHTSLQAAGGNVKYFKIYRWDPEVEGQKPYIATYAVNLDE
jgi:hypothetical protein